MPLLTELLLGDALLQRIVFDRSTERRCDLFRPFRACVVGGIYSQGVALGFIIMAFQAAYFIPRAFSWCPGLSFSLLRSFRPVLSHGLRTDLDAVELLGGGGSEVGEASGGCEGGDGPAHQRGG